MNEKEKDKTHNEDAIRGNYFGDRYAEIAMKECYEALQLFDDCEKSTTSLMQYMKLWNQLINKSLVSIVFSYMALESFFNDYCAKKLGDEEYYNSFDSLPFVSKFLFINIVIFNKKIDKANSPCYSLLCELSKTRNEIIHNKSKELHFDDFAKKESTNQTVDDHDTIHKDNIRICQKLCIEELNKSKKSIRALLKLVEYFDSKDPNAKAKENILGIYDGVSNYLYDDSYKDYVIEKLRFSW